ncbi:YaaC family protein [Paraburkholderia franconis]|uniref:YaaC family protein n=1 Tax=Paraburkholderia franconis TaxID=2654983 RepID=UPI002AB2D1D0|nr:YaaC family protein [Paraburkholderia franconis]
MRLQAEFVDNIDWTFYRKRLPVEVVALPGSTPAIQSVASTTWATANSPTNAELDALCQLNASLRRVFHYINGAHTLWYLKTTGSYEINRMPITLTLSAMHRLSEICRYKPSQLQSYLDGQKNWLLSEFVAMTPAQFLDEIASEMTGHQIMIPNVRLPKAVSWSEGLGSDVGTGQQWPEEHAHLYDGEAGARREDGPRLFRK